jgi:glycine/D-amino acid oxidase-like deaminating enzyme
VGQGLAGTCLSHALRMRGRSVLIFDNHHTASSSLVAGGLFNPVTGRNMVLTWKAHDIFPFLHTFYRRLEDLLKEEFLYNIPIYRPFISIEEQNEWEGKNSENLFREFIKQVHVTPFNENLLPNPFGGLEMRQTGYVNTKKLIGSYATLLRGEGTLLSEWFDPDLVNLRGENVVYKEYLSKKIIFCEGPEALSNKWFQRVKLVPLKGEVLRIKTSEPLNKIYNRGIFILPIDGDGTECVVGSTYDRADVSWETTASGRDELEQKLQQMIKCDYEVTDHRAGIRPTVVDRRPVIGLHPEDERIAIFNGLGTKGVSLAPFFADHFAQYLTEGADLSSEVDVRRFF